ncbi:unnamed protein product [Vicia faba]|uniref:Uncharacterized protein n=1 Tax=Vicia faba TaxID=3906 RepID=A0AAV0YIH4_VICFA|nr:unnamed protein product [Vicia faba]
MGRSPCCDKTGLKKGPWTHEEDLLLVNYINTHGAGNWRNLPKNAGLQRCGKSCRLRWTNYLRPDIKRGRFSFEEEEAIIQLHSVLGNKWSAIAARLPGRTDNEIKNYWNTHIRKRLLRSGIDPVTHTPRLDHLFDMSSINILRSALLGSNPSFLNLLGGAQALMNPELLKLAATATLLNNNMNLVSQNQQQFNNVANYSTQQQAQNNQVSLQDQFQIPTQTHNNIITSSISAENSNPCNFEEDLISKQYSELFHCLNHGNNNNMGYESVISSTPLWTTPTPTPTPSSTYVNSCTEEERDTYCSDIFKFEIPESGLDINDFL